MTTRPDRRTASRRARRVALVLALSPLGLHAQDAPVQVYLVQHTEVDPSGGPPYPLSAQGRARAALIAPTFRGVAFTHLFASHTLRSLQTIEPLAAERSLPVVQLPRPGSMLDGRPVTDTTTRRAPIEPIAAALRELPAGSVAMVAGNSENIFAILARLGVPVAPEGTACERGAMCVPCLDNRCWPTDAPDRVWYVALERGRARPLAFAELRYGVGWRAAAP